MMVRALAGGPSRLVVELWRPSQLEVTPLGHRESPTSETEAWKH